MSEEEKQLDDNQKSKLIKMLEDFQIELIEKIKRASAKLGDVSSQKVSKLKNLIFEDNSLNMMKRKAAFLKIKIQKYEVQILNFEIYLYLDKKDQAQKYITLLSQDPLQYDNDKLTYVLNKEFFLFDFGEKYIKIQSKIKKLTSKFNHFNHFLDHQKTPMYVSHFEKFFKEEIIKEKDKYDSSISYCPPLNIEVTISRYIFNSKTSQREKIDNFISKISDLDRKDTSNFNQDLILLAFSFVPQSCRKDQSIQSISLLVFYRLIFERIYEKNYNFIFFNHPQEILNLEKVSFLPTKYFHIPALFFDKNEDLTVPIKYFCQNHVGMSQVPSLLDETMFYTNPIDPLYLIHKIIMLIHKAGDICLEKKKKDEKYTNISITEKQSEDSQRLLCFDDLFSLLICSFLSSSISDIFALSDFLDELVPRHNISNSFEYAQAGIAALAMHCKNLTVDFVMNNPLP